MTAIAPGSDSTIWFGLFAPHAFPEEAMARLPPTALRIREVTDRLEQLGFVPWFMSPDELTAYIAAETDRWVTMAREVNIQPE